MRLEEMPEPRVCAVCLQYPCQCPEMGEDHFDESELLAGIERACDLAELRFVGGAR